MKKLRPIASIGGKNPTFVLWAGSVKEAGKWERLLRFLAESALLTAETGYDTYPLRDEEGMLCWHTFHTLRAMGVELPKTFPEELDFDYERAADEADSDRFWELLLCRNPYSTLIFEIYEALNNVYGFYAAYVAPLMDDDRLELDGTAAENIEPGLMNLAACKVEIGEDRAPNLRQFRRIVLNDHEQWLILVKDAAFRARVPLRAELLALVHKSSAQLRGEAQAESVAT